MRKYPKINLICMLMLGLATILGIGLPVASAQELNQTTPKSWQTIELENCRFATLSKFYPNSVYCNSKSQNVGEYDLNLFDLKNPINPKRIFTANIAFDYEDPNSGFVYVISSGGDFGRYNAALGASSYAQIIRGGPNDYITASLIRSAGPGTGVLFFRWSNFSLWFSSYDNGQTWQQRFEQEDPHNHAVIYDVQFSVTNPQIVYGLSRTVTELQPDGRYLNYSYLYKSTDMGRNFDRISRTDTYYTTSDAEEVVPAYSLYLPPTAARDEALVYVTRALRGGYTSYLRSIDGGKSFETIGTRGFDAIAPDGSLLKATDQTCQKPRQCLINWPAVRSTDNGNSYQSMIMDGYAIERFFLPPQNPNVYFALARPIDSSQPDTAHSHLIRSTDGGANWDFLPDGPYLDGEYYRDFAITVSDYAPTSLIVNYDPGYSGSPNKFYIWQDDAADQLQTKAVPARSGQLYFEQTRHNMGNLFKDYWNTHGGLAQFGYPKTEVIREVNPSDGHIYYTQYFERNRFEYHPENKGTQYEVLLGLLGNQLTAERRAAGAGAFNRFTDMHYPGGSYYPQTGHNLRNSFKAYWEANGGLALYGYPISEEFEEVNPDDGKTYLVQYFERNRFEYHPENKGTKYDVLLGLMGNSLLKQKSWL